MSNRYRWIIVLMLMATIALQFLKIKDLEKQIESLQNRPPIIYHADNYGGMTGKVMARGKDGDSYYVDIKGYGRFLITEEQFDTIVVGEDAPKEIWKRGS